jgi:uncharacterized membrane protein YeiH
MVWAILSIYATLAFMAVGGLLAGRRYDDASVCALIFAVLLGIGAAISNAPAFR